MEITEARPSTRVAMRLDMIKPIKACNDITFTLEPLDHGTQVVWAMQGPLPLLSRLVHLVMDMDKLVGGDFERGLAYVKRLAEASK